MAVSILACSSAPEKSKPYWLQVANGFADKGIVFYQQQKYAASTVEFNRALNAYQRFDYVEGLAESYLNLAKSEIAQSNISNAKDYLRQLKALVEENNFTSMAVHLDIMQSSIAINMGESGRVIEILDKYLGSVGENKMNVAENIYMALLTNRVKVSILSASDSEKWVNIYEAKVVKNDFYRARLLRFKGQLAGKLNKVNVVNKKFSQALNLYREQANPKSVLSTLKEWGAALNDNKKFEGAIKRFEAAYKVAESSTNEFETRNVLNSLLKVYKNIGDEKNIQRINHLISE